MRRKGYLVFAALSSLSVAALLGGCGQVVLLNPKGPIGGGERNLIFLALGLMMIVVIPVVFMALWFPRKYSASNKKATYTPKWSSSLKLEVVVWLVPIAIVTVLGYLAWSKTHQLDPYIPIDRGVKPVNIQVVSLDWKWLFIYPRYNIAAVNELVFPVGVPLSFTITSDTVMNSFSIPQLGSQMYSMAGMVTRLHLEADKPGVYTGQSQQFSGKGFAYMNFQAHAVSRSEFEAWLEKVERSPSKLNSARFKVLQEPSVANPVAYFAAVEPGLFDLIVSHYMSMDPGAMSGANVRMHVSKSAPGGIDMFGKLTLSAIPYNDPIVMGAVGGSILIAVAILALITWYGKWSYLWNEWLTSLDHKRIGVMYIILALVMLLRGLSDAVMMRSQQALAVGASKGYLLPSHFDQVFTAHGTIMILFMAMPFIVGLMNIVVPQQIGARDVAFPLLNSLSLWLTVAGALLVMVSLGVGEFSKAGWSGYSPLAETQFSPGVGVDYWTWAFQIAGIASLMSGINFFVTILRMRALGMKLMRMPLFTWTTLCTNVLMICAFPVLTVALAMLSLDRYLGMHFFTNAFGGNMMMYANLFWMWGHPEVYIVVLPAFGVFSEVVATFSGKRLFGYKSLVYATWVITVLSFVVWLHHFFTMGASPDVNAFFGITTMIIAVPTGVKIFDWLFTMYRGRVRLTAPMYWTLGFIVSFTTGGAAGVLLGMPPADYVLHNSLFLVAHFHTMLISGTLFGVIAGYMYWFPKVTGFRLNEKLGKSAFFFWLIGFYLAFGPLYLLGLMGMPRRMWHYSNPAWRPWLLVAAGGTALIVIGTFLLIVQLVVSFRQRQTGLDSTGDPYDGRTLEWASSSPPPIYNFAEIPAVHDIDAFMDMKEKGVAYKRPAQYHDIEIPRNSGVGFIIGVLSFLLGFALIWYIWWLAASCAAGILTAVIVRSFDEDIHRVISAIEVERIEDQRYKALAELQS